MTKKQFKLTVIAMIVILILYGVIGWLIKFYIGYERYYDFWQDLTPMTVTILISIFIFSLQRRISYIQTIHYVLQQLTPTIQSAIQYTYLLEPTLSDFSKLQSDLTMAINSLGVISQPVPKEKNPIDLSLNENLKHIKSIITELGFEKSSHSSNDFEQAREAITELWQTISLTLSKELDSAINLTNQPLHENKKNRINLNDGSLIQSKPFKSKVALDTTEKTPHEQKSSKLPGSTGEHKVQEMLGNTRRALAFYNKQVLNYLNPLMCEFISAQEMLFIATADAHGECDCSFRAGLVGFVHVINNKLIAYPEYRGNGVMASIGNITENPHIGVIFIDFLHSTIGLHINGKASIVENEALLARQDVPAAMIKATQIKGGRSVERWIFVEVEEAYIHCSKHIPLLQKLDKNIHWGTDNQHYKGGDAFNAKSCPRPWVTNVEE